MADPVAHSNVRAAPLTTPQLPRCVVCGDENVEAHHWAPRAIFPEWSWDLIVDLCPTHHREWHDAMRVHGLRWPHELPSQEVLDRLWRESALA
jgi:hypothetical protein